MKEREMNIDFDFSNSIDNPLALRNYIKDHRIILINRLEKLEI